MRPNIAQDAPPTVITVGGIDYNAETDFRVWIDVISVMKEIYTSPNTFEQAMHNTEVIAEIEKMVFGKIIPHPANEVLDAVAAFSKGYPEAPVGEGGDGVQTYSFEHDLNYIVIAIRNQSGIDLSYRRKEPFHWWEFLLEFRSLCGDHYILRLMEIRGYKGKDRDLQKQAQRFALPRVTTADDKALLDEFDDIFFGA